MTIEKKREGNRLEVALTGRLDTITAPELEGELKGATDGVTELDFDFQNLEYISSAGLRVLLMQQKLMNRQGTMTIRHVNQVIGEVFRVTGFASILKIVD